MNPFSKVWRGRGWRWTLLRLSLLLIVLLVLPLLGALLYMTWMPGANSAAPDGATSSPRVQALEAELRATVEHLAGTIGERNLQTSGSLEKTADFLEAQLAEAGITAVRETYNVDGTKVANLVVERAGSTRPTEIIVVGAHYDSVFGSPGADDNASGTAAALALARAFAGWQGDRTLRFVFFVNEEAPYAMTPRMGSYVYAGACRKRGEDSVGMFSLESLGYYTDAPNSQQYPMEAFKRLYPSTGNFITFIGDTSSRDLLTRALGSFRRHATVPSEGAALPRKVPGVGWSDHWSFWVHGYQAVMVTGTAPFRNPNYHTPHDTPNTLDYDRMARVVAALEEMLKELSTAD